MKTAVVTAAILMSVGVAVAAPAPVEDVAGGSSEDRVARLERIIKAKQAAELDRKSVV